MPIVKLQRILDHALRHRYAVGYFEAWDLYSLEAALEAAEEARAPAILGFGAAVTNGAWYDRNGMEALSALTVTLAQRAEVPAAVLFNEAQTYAQAVRGLAGGCNAVMLDSSHLPAAEHEAATRDLVQVAHALGAAVEAELGHLATAGDPSHVAAPTDPAEAARFVAATGIDALAVAIGNVHIMTAGEADVDLELLGRIHTAVPLPLVIHGGTGFPQRAVADAIRLGAAKFNVGTVLKQVFFEGIMAAAGGQAATQASIHALMGSRDAADVMLQGKLRMKAKILELIDLYGSAGRATSL
jgi:fructose-bisphosphate aldolase class II